MAFFRWQIGDGCIFGGYLHMVSLGVPSFHVTRNRVAIFLCQ